ncbi:2-phospho-L-lactate guanylyltransferase [Methanobrevibacter sp. OttesenSCG-928-K11]|nr:2-phospho-L-lactate guanylyltransferase [Methanobrevibacter sp. OttesenSCG-928-K11]MDL2270330.1 2-phospho-L-lactate guanylyltransferase [Methanobrevibacter sp. OttesenSCG-928-I08]
MDEIYAIIPVSKFKNAKTRLSPFLNEQEREDILKAMLKDVTDALKECVDKIILISSDEDVLDYAHKLNIDTLKENENSNLNKALHQAMDYCKDKVEKIVITPSDIPLIGKTNINLLIEQGKTIDFMIIPSKGGGTNLLLIEPNAIPVKFGDFSFISHIKEATEKEITPYIQDSFFIALDVNTTEDLGEIMVHGNNTETKNFLKSLNIKVESIHGSNRLKVTRK